MEPKSLSDLVELRVEFDRCWPWLWAALCEFGPTHNKEQVWFKLCSGKAFLWSGHACAIVGEFINYPIGFRAFNYWLQGGNLTELLTLHPGIEAWAETKGCQRIDGDGREGWIRKMSGNWQKGPIKRYKWLIKR